MDEDDEEQCPPEDPSVGYRKGGPPHRKRKEDPDEDKLPPCFDLDKLKLYRTLYPPGGLWGAIERAQRNRHSTLQGAVWMLRGMELKPGEWVRVGENWLLIFSIDLEKVVVVSQRGGYSAVPRALARDTIVETGEPPWLDEWFETQLTGKKKV